jgi:tetratricopeptide (TPR) repeat protein
MTALQDASVSARTRLGTAASERGNKTLTAWPGTGTILALCLFLLSAQASPSQRKPAKTAAVAFQQEQELLRQGRIEEAKAAMLEELKRNPSSVDGYNLLGIIEADAQNYSSALAAFQKALQLAPHSTKTLNNLGNVYVAQKMPDLAEKEFQTVLRLDPANRDAHYNLGLLLLTRGSAAEAIPHLERVRPQDTQTRLNLIRAYLQAKRAADGLRVAKELSAESKDDVQVHFSLGVLLASEKQYSAARIELEKADALKPETFEILFNLGLDLLRMGESSQAELALNRALKLKPHSVETLSLLAEACMDQSRPLDALNLLLQAHKIAPDNTDVILLMARTSMYQKYFEDAIPLLESGLEIAPQRTDLLGPLGESYFMAGKVEKAIETLQKLVAAQPSARAYAFLGLAHTHLGRFDEAKQDFQNGLKLDPRNTFCLFNLGYIAERQGDSARAEVIFQKVLSVNPEFSDAILELANLRIEAKRLPEAAELLRKYVRASRSPATGYYKLAMVERSLHQAEAADRDLAKFQALAKDASTSSIPYEHLFEYLDSRSNLAPGARQQLDLNALIDQVGKHPGEPEGLYLLAEAYLKSGKADEAKSTIAQLDKLSSGDYRTLTGTGVLLARYRFYDGAIQHFRAALDANPNSDEIKFDLANAYFRERLYSQALEAAEQVSVEGRKDDAYLALLGDIYAHLGDTMHAGEILRDSITRNPDNDQDYLSLALLKLRGNDIAGAEQTLLKGQSRVPGSGKIFWGLGLASAMEGKTREASGELERAVDLLPEWQGSYAVLGVFYFETGQIAKAREVLGRFRNSSASGSLDIGRIEQVLERAPANPSSATDNEPLSMTNRAQLLQLALSLADRTL